MKRLAAAVLGLAIALPACAQRGGSGHAGFAVHGGPAAQPAPGFHGGFTPSRGGSFGPSAPVHYGYGGGAGYGGSSLAHAPVSYPSSMRLLAPGVRYPVTAPIIRPTFYHPGHPSHPIHVTHSFFISTYPLYPYAYPYAYAYPSYVYGYLPADMLDDSFKNYDNSQQPQPEPQPDYGSAYPQPMPQPEYGYPQPAPQPESGYAYPQPQPEAAYAYPGTPPGYQSYTPQPAPAAPQMQYVPGSATTVILIYKDGRPPEQIENYLATRSTLTVLDGARRREIPLSDLNIPATVSANRETGVDFQLPGMTR